MNKFNNTVKTTLAKTFTERVEDRVLIREGLIYSFSSNTLKSTVSRSFKDKITHIEEENLLMGYVKNNKLKNPNTVVFVFGHTFDADDILKFHKILNQCGYVVVKKNLNFTYNHLQSQQLYQVEPKFPVVFKFPLDKIRMFHITQKSSLDKIMQIGLCAKTSKTTFNHDGNRIYLFITNDPDICIPKLKSMLALDKNKAIEEMVALEISPHFHTDEEYFLDMSFTQIPKICYAVFTFNAIPRTYIKVTTY